MANWNGFKGAAKRIESVDITRIAADIGVGEDEVHAFAEVEAAGSGFDNKDRPKMLFEPHVFYRNLNGAKRDRAVREGLAYRRWGTKRYPRESYTRLLKAIKIDEAAALKSASWGRSQVLGENFRMIGYDSPQDMVRRFMDDEEAHIEGMIQFCVGAGIDDDLRRLAGLNRRTTPDDCVPIVRVYNGPDFRRNNYHVKFARAHNKWRGIPDTKFTDEEIEASRGDAPFRVTKIVVERVQRQLKELGYHEVGDVDGDKGPKTDGAILVFRNDNGLPLVPEIDEEFVAILMAAKPRPVGDDRAGYNVADLREEGSRTIQHADNQQMLGSAAAGVGVLGIGGQVLAGIEEQSGAIQTALDLVEPVTAFVSEHWLWLLAGVGVAVFWNSGKIKLARLFDHRSGKHNGR